MKETENVVSVIPYHDHNIEIVQDSSPQAPDEWDNSDAFLIYDHPDFCVKVKGFDAQEVFDSFIEKKKLYDGYYVFPVFAYIHSGVALSMSRTNYPFTDQWDVSFKGFVLVKRQKGTFTPDKARELGRCIVNEWNTYLSGDVYGFRIKDENNHVTDSVWGFYGDWKESGIINEAKAYIK